jgi:hypothetical protein
VLRHGGAQYLQQPHHVLFVYTLPKASARDTPRFLVIGMFSISSIFPFIFTLRSFRACSGKLSSGFVE